MSASSRRSFLKGGAIVAAPLAMAASGAAAAESAHKDQAEIRALHQAWLRQVNAEGLGEVRSLRPDLEAAPDEIELAADGQSARGRFHLLAEVATEMPRDCTLAQMAHAQGEGLLRRTEPRLAKARYVKAGGTWVIAKVALS